MSRRKAAADTDSEHVDQLWIVEVWLEFRPYLVRLSTDCLIFLTIWLVLFGAQALTTHLPLDTKLARFLVNSHEAVVVLTFAWLSLKTTWDVLKLRRRK